MNLRDIMMAKTISSGGSGGVTVQADWQQNNSYASDYVKNRTHWLEEDASLYNEATYEVEVGGGANLQVYTHKSREEKDGGTLDVFVGDRLIYRRVRINGAETVVHSDWSGLDVTYVVRQDVLDRTTKRYQSQILLESGQQITFRVVFYQKVFTPLDERFVPDTIARVKDIPVAASEYEFVEFLNDISIVEPLASASGEIYTTNNNELYIL